MAQASAPAAAVAPSVPMAPEPEPYAAADVPEDYHPIEADVARAVTEVGWREATAGEYAQAKEDAVVRQVIDLFDGALIAVRTQVTPQADSETE